MDNMDAVRDAEGFIQLNPTCSNLWKKSAYRTKETRIINRIYEYDIRSANTSALRTAKKLKPATLDEIEELPRHDREVRVGKMILKDPAIGETIKTEIRRAKRQLFMANGIQDEEVLSIKNDAVFIIGRRLPQTEFGYMVFKEKNAYSGYLFVEKLELYYNRRTHTVDIKGIKDEVVEDPDHQNGIIQFLAQVMEHLAMDRMGALRKYLIQFTDDYKSKRLPVEFYKDMSGENIYRTDMEVSGFCFQMQSASESDKPMINGTYNFKRFVLPMIQLFI